MKMIGHNQGPTMDKGRGWRRYAWTKARAELLPNMPIEIVRRRVKRARELGLDYKTYAGIRASTGRDVIAFLFSDNALRLMRDARIEPARADKLDALRQATCLALVHPPHDAARVAEVNAAILRASEAPGLAATWGDTRDAILALKQTIPADGVLVIGETWLERDWCGAARLAGFLPAERYFGT